MAIFTVKTFNLLTRNELRQDIMNALESTPEIRNEIRRVFQVANRRIQNIESKDDIVSPAVQSLCKGNITRFTKFSMRGTWEDLKREYAKAIGFLHQPTSTLTGVREYNDHIKAQYDLSDDEFGLMAQQLNDKLLSVSDSNFVEQYLMRYKDFTGELEMAVSDIAQQIETDAAKVQQALDREVNRGLDTTTNVIDNIVKLFDEFGL